MFIPSAEMQKELLPGERVLWAGRPLGGLRFDTKSWYETAFGVVFFSFSVFWIIGAANQSGALSNMRWESISFTLFGVPFALIGFYLVIGKYVFDILARARTEYAVTSQRVIMRTAYFGSSTRSIDYRKYPNIILKENSDNSGAIVFGEPQQHGEGTIAPPSLVALADARTVYNIIRKAAATSAA